MQEVIISQAQLGENHFQTKKTKLYVLGIIKEEAQAVVSREREKERERRERQRQRQRETEITRFCLSKFGGS